MSFCARAQFEGFEPHGRLFYVDRQRESHLTARGLGFGNGVVVRPDGKTLLVGESLFNRILEFPEQGRPGPLGAQRLFAYLPQPDADQPAAKPDGLVLDEDSSF